MLRHEVGLGTGALPQRGSQMLTEASQATAIPRFAVRVQNSLELGSDTTKYPKW
jgi:hypothetical protein